MRRTLIQDSSEALRNAVNNGVVDTILSPFQEPYLQNLLSFVQGKKSLHVQDPKTFELASSNQSLRWQESQFEPQSQVALAEYYAVELAQFAVPKGSIGFVRYVDQVLNDVDGNYYPSNQEYWGSPHFVFSDIDNCRWYLTLDFFDGQMPAPFVLSSAVAFTSQSLPGIPYTDLPQISRLWYPAHSGKELKLLVPGNRVLRLFFYTPPTTLYRWQVMGKLSGWTQSTYTQQAKANARIVQ
jgi:hypothetical protein